MSEELKKCSWCRFWRLLHTIDYDDEDEDGHVAVNPIGVLLSPRDEILQAMDPDEEVNLTLETLGACTNEDCPVCGQITLGTKKCEYAVITVVEGV